MHLPTHSIYEGGYGVMESGTEGEKWAPTDELFSLFVCVSVVRAPMALHSGLVKLSNTARKPGNARKVSVGNTHGRLCLSKERSWNKNQNVPLLERVGYDVIQSRLH